MSAEPEISIVDYAVRALAEAMAYRLDPVLGTPPSAEIYQRAIEIVRGVLDVSGRRFAVLLDGSEDDAKRLAMACGKNGDFIDEALRVIGRLVDTTEGPQR